MSAHERKRLRGERGVALVEVIVGIMVLATLLLSLAAASGLAARQLYYSRRDMDLWSALQAQAESLQWRGYGSIVDGSGTRQGYPMTWAVTGTDPEIVTIIASWTNRAGQSVADTLVLVLPSADTL
jgi:Tfp pilus assembly protein PilV